MKTLAIVPAKGNSRRLPGKNKRLLGGKPLFMYAVDAAKSAGCSVVVSTDDGDIYMAALRIGVQAHSEPSGGCGLEQVRREILAAHPFEFDLVLMLLPTYPFRSAMDIERLISMLDESPAEEAQSATRIDRMGGLLLPNSYLAGRVLHVHENSAEKGVRLYFPIDHRRAIDIDTQDDWDRAERVLPLFDFSTGRWSDGYTEGR